ncbi:MAG: GreA/GreB family elongation factor [bacterium]
MNDRISKIEDWLKRADIIQSPKNNGIVQIGSVVTVEENNKQKTFKILGPSEANPEKNIISHLSPIGSALMSKKVGDVVEIRLIKRKVVCRVVGVG